MAGSARFEVPEGKFEAYARPELDAEDALGSLRTFDGSQTRNLNSENSLDGLGTQGAKDNKTKFSMFNREKNSTSDSTIAASTLSSISIITPVTLVASRNVEDQRETKGDGTDTKIRDSRGSQVISDGEGTKYPPTTYSMIAIGDTSAKAFGIFVFVIQVALLLLLVFGHLTYDVKQNFQNKDLGSTCITTLAKLVSTIGFLFFTDCCLSDASNAIYMCPNPFREHQIKNNKWVFFSCILQLLIGLCCGSAALFLINSKSDPFLIVLSITTVGTVAQFDETAFILAGKGRYSMGIAKAAAMVETTSLPHYAVCSHLKEKNPEKDKTFTLHRRHVFKVYVGILFFATVVLSCVFAWYHGNRSNLSTSHVQVHFNSTTGLHNHNGCYQRPPVKWLWLFHRADTKGVYTTEDEAGARLGFCKTRWRWVFFTGDTENPCEGEILLQSKSFPRFMDVSSTFNAPWFYPVKGDNFDDYDFIFPYLDEHCSP